MSLRFVALDLGNVLCDLDVPGALNRFWRCTGVDPRRVEAAVFDSGVWEALEVGSLTPADFRALVCKELGVRLSPADFDACWNHIPTARPGADALVERLALPHAVWSNTDPIHAEHLRGTLRAIGSAVHCQFSFSCRARKPDVRFYNGALEALQASPEEVLFIDDRAENLEAARLLGLVVQQARSLDAVEQALSRHGVLRHP